MSEMKRCEDCGYKSFCEFPKTGQCEAEEEIKARECRMCLEFRGGRCSDDPAIERCYAFEKMEELEEEGFYD